MRTQYRDQLFMVKANHSKQKNKKQQQSSRDKYRRRRLVVRFAFKVLLIQ